MTQANKCLLLIMVLVIAHSSLPADPCVQILCPQGTYCSKGKCWPDSCNGTCKANQKCEAGKCITPVVDPCKGVSCPAGRFCQDGFCKDPYASLCLNITCKTGYTCKQGLCIKVNIPPWLLNNCNYFPCSETYKCINGRCRQRTCSSGKATDCPMRHNCSKGICILADEECIGVECPRASYCAQAMCSTTKVCLNGLDDECPSFHRCLDKICMKENKCKYAKCQLGYSCLDGSCLLPNDQCWGLDCGNRSCANGQCSKDE